MCYCKEDDCRKRASYGFDFQKPQYCNLHKKENMRNVKYKKCKNDECFKQPHFNIEGEKGLYCGDHKKEGMVNINKGSRCKENSCCKRATFGIDKVSYCLTHRKENMKCLANRKECKEEKCGKCPTYGNELKNPLYCSIHRKEKMVDVIHKQCKKEGCLIRPVYGYIFKNPLCCINHKEDSMVDVVHKRCINCNLMRAYIDKKYCRDCFVFLFPDNKKVKLYRNKERYIREKLENDFKDLSFIFDKQVECGCNKKRPDIFLDLYSYCIIIEVDEFQHKLYDCEQKRIMGIFESLGNRNLIVIRFNPDNYIDKNGVKNRKSLMFCKNGVIKETQDFKNRYMVLKEHLKYFLENKPTKELTIKYLFYDNKI